MLALFFHSDETFTEVEIRVPDIQHRIERKRIPESQIPEKDRDMLVKMGPIPQE